MAREVLDLPPAPRGNARGAPRYPSSKPSGSDIMSIAYRIALFLLLCCTSAAQAAGLWGPQGFGGFSSGLEAASEAALKKATKDYWTVLQHRTGLQLERIRVATFTDIDSLLARAIQGGLGTLELFSQKELADPSAPALLLEGSTLRRIDAKYDLSGAWMISARTQAPDHRPMNMDYMIVGQGKLIIGYPYESSVEVIEEGRPMEYRYEPYIEADIVNSGSRHGLFEIKTLNDPAADFLTFQGPMGATIKSFQLEGNAVLVNYSLGFDQQAHSDKTPIVLRHTHMAQAS